MVIKNFKSKEELFNWIKIDKESHRISDNRFPVRFIFLNSFEELKEIFSLLSSNNEIIELDKFLSDDNTWLTPDEIINFTKKLTNNSVIIPISEFLRFLDKDLFYILLKSFTEIEKKDIRIYIPLVGLWERFDQEFWTNFYRKKEWAPIFKLNTSPVKSHIYQLDFEFDTKYIDLNEFEVISNIKEWFNLWKKNPVKGIISLPKPLSYYYKYSLPDQTFDLEVLSNQKKFMQIIFGSNINIDFNINEIEFWNKLVLELNNYQEKGITLKKIFSNHFNIKNVDKLNIKDYCILFFNFRDQYDKWLIKNFFMSIDKFKDSYLYHCFNKTKKLGNENLSNILWEEVFNLNLNYTIDNFLERKNLLKILSKNFNLSINDENLNINLRVIKNFPLKKQFMYLTNITCTERKYILELIRDIDINLIYSDLKELYPELYYYFNWDLILPDNKIDTWIIKYLKEYNLSKIKNTKLDTIETLINTKNKDETSFCEWYYSIPKSNIENDFYCIWVDGLGAEWFPLIIHLIEIYSKDNNKSIKKKMITRVTLPSITKCNKYNFDKIEDLDYFIHKQKAYKYPNTLIEEIVIIKKIIKKILNLPHKKICILSDHGYTFLCSNEFGNNKKLKFGDSEHDGRYMWIDKNYNEDEYFFVWPINEGNCQNKKAIVASKHVSLNNTPYREVHGGATPEEILVPYILIETNIDEIEYNIEPNDFEISTSKPLIQFKISPLPSYIPEAFFKNQSLNLSQKNNLYSLELNSFKVGKHLILLKIGKRQYELNVNIKGGFKERDLI